ncbi:hypothetical protein ACFFMO_10055 [Lederbergia wuyishanensis]
MPRNNNNRARIVAEVGSFCTVEQRMRRIRCRSAKHCTVEQRMRRIHSRSANH